MTTEILNSLGIPPLPSAESCSVPSERQRVDFNLGQRTANGPAGIVGAVIATIALLLGSALAGCANTNAVRVQPWERASLADYTMRSDRDPLGDAVIDHVFFAREAASGGKGVGGSGCGCN